MIKQIIIVRHAIAENPKEAFIRGKSDAVRYLSIEGIEKLEQATEGLIKILPQIDLIATSPLLRAVETADILFKHLKAKDIITTKLLKPGINKKELISWIQKQTAETVLIVGHEPDLGKLASWLLCGKAITAFKIKKAGAMLIKTNGTLKPKSCTLKWFLTPKQLRILGATE